MVKRIMYKKIKQLKHKGYSKSKVSSGLLFLTSSSFEMILYWPFNPISSKAYSNNESKLVVIINLIRLFFTNSAINLWASLGKVPLNILFVLHLGVKLKVPGRYMLYLYIWDFKLKVYYIFYE